MKLDESIMNDNIDVANDGQEALDKVTDLWREKNEQYGLIISDC
jgi:hypothetical protein